MIDKRSDSVYGGIRTSFERGHEQTCVSDDLDSGLSDRLDEPLEEDRTTEPGTVPEARAPEVERPSAEVPTTERPGTSSSPTDPDQLRARYSDVDPAFRTLFWKIVLLYKLAIVGLSLGVLFVVFDANPTLGSQLALGGGIAFLYGLYLTRKGKAKLDAGEYDLDDDGNGHEGSGTVTDAEDDTGGDSKAPPETEADTTHE